MAETSVKELDRLFAKQKAAFAKDRMPSLDSRLDRLRTLDRMLIDFRAPIQQALAADFGSHHPLVTDLFESGGVIARSRHIQSQLAIWMAPDERRDS